MLHVKVDSAVFELVLDIGTDAPDSPVSENWSAVHVNLSLFHETELDVITHVICLILEFTEVAWEDRPVQELFEVWVDLVLCQVLGLIVLVLYTRELQVKPL